MNKPLSSFSSRQFSASFKQKGFTLLEVLIAISLSAVIMVVLSVGFHQISSRWEQSDSVLEERLDESMVLLELEKAIMGAFPYTYRKKNFERVVFFEGQPSSLRWVSTMSPAYDNQSMIWWLKVKSGGGLAIQVTPALTGDPNEIIEDISAKPTEILTGFKIRFEYLGLDNKQKRTWRKQWSAKEKQALPVAVRIKLEQSRSDYGDDARKLEVLAMIPAHRHSNIAPRY